MATATDLENEEEEGHSAEEQMSSTFCDYKLNDSSNTEMDVETQQDRVETSFLIGSFSSVSTATIASEDAFCSIFRDLQDLHSSRDLNLHFFANFRQFIFQNFDKF